MKNDRDVLIIGAGPAGLACANALQIAGLDVAVLEASNRVGGRMGSDRQDAFILDRGFQVYLTSYPEGRRFLDYAALRLKPFLSGARIHLRDQHADLVHPLRHPVRALSVPASDFLTARDTPVLMRVLAESGLRARARPNSRIPLSRYLSEQGFSDKLTGRFLQPFFSGVFLDADLQTSVATFLDFFRHFALGRATLPENGMQAIPDQMAALLAGNTVQFHHAVKRIDNNSVTCTNGTTWRAERIVVATDMMTACRIAGLNEVVPWNGTTSYYYATEACPDPDAILHLNGTGLGPLNHLAIPTNLSAAYAPPGCL